MEGKLREAYGVQNWLEYFLLKIDRILTIFSDAGFIEKNFVLTRHAKKIYFAVESK